MNMHTTLIRTAVFDKDPMFALGICSLLEKTADVHAVAVTLTDAGLHTLAPDMAGMDIVILDPAQFAHEPADLVAQMRRDFGARGMIGFCSEMPAARAAACLRAGFRGMLPKRAGLAALQSAITAVHNGSFCLDPIYASALDGSATATRARRGSTLTERESYVLKAVAIGKSLKQIGQELNLSAKTVETYKARGSGKLNLQGRRAIVEYAIRAGWVH